MLSGHVHQFRTSDIGGRLHVWAPTTWAVLPEYVQPTVGLKRCGACSIELDRHGIARVELVDFDVAQLDAHRRRRVRMLSADGLTRSARERDSAAASPSDCRVRLSLAEFGCRCQTSWPETSLAVWRRAWSSRPRSSTSPMLVPPTFMAAIT